MLGKKYDSENVCKWKDMWLKMYISVNVHKCKGIKNHILIQKSEYG